MPANGRRDLIRCLKVNICKLLYNIMSVTKAPVVTVFMQYTNTSIFLASKKQQYKGVSKSPRTMLIKCKSLVVHEFPTKVCCGGVLWMCRVAWLDAEAFDCCTCLCVYCIGRLRFSDINGTAEVDEQRVCIKFCVRLGKTVSEVKETVINDPTLLLNVITGDESIVYAYDPETKLQSS